jgi:hypothetical protein
LEGEAQKWPFVSITVTSSKDRQFHNIGLEGEGKGSFHAAEKWFECFQK